MSTKESNEGWTIKNKKVFIPSAEAMMLSGLDDVNPISGQSATDKQLMRVLKIYSTKNFQRL